MVLRFFEKVEFDHSEQNLKNLKDLKEPEKEFKEVMDEVGLVEKQGEELNHAYLLDSDETENVLHAEEADPIKLLHGLGRFLQALRSKYRTSVSRRTRTHAHTVRTRTRTANVFLFPSGPTEVKW